MIPYDNDDQTTTMLGQKWLATDTTPHFRLIATIHASFLTNDHHYETRNYACFEPYHKHVSNPRTEFARWLAAGAYRLVHPRQHPASKDASLPLYAVNACWVLPYHRRTDRQLE